MYLLMWCYDRGFSNGTETKEFDTLESALEYLEKHKLELWFPSLYQKLEVK